jgi:hypothetical protein
LSRKKWLSFDAKFRKSANEERTGKTRTREHLVTSPSA